MHTPSARDTHVHNWEASMLVGVQARRARPSNMQGHAHTARTHMHTLRWPEDLPGLKKRMGLLMRPIDDKAAR